jgi:hypothetical protein
MTDKIGVAVVGVGFVARAGKPMPQVSRKLKTQI